MRSVVCRHAALAVADTPEPTARDGAGASRGAALRLLRVGPPRPPWPRRLGRHGREDGLRPFRPLGRADRLRARVLGPCCRARPGLPARPVGRHTLDPAEASPYTAADGHGHLTDAPAAFELAIGKRERLERLPIGWWHAW